LNDKYKLILALDRKRTFNYYSLDDASDDYREMNKYNIDIS